MKNVHQAIELLNTLVKIDPEWVNKIMFTRYPAMPEISSSTEVQVVQIREKYSIKFEAGALGLINALYGVHIGGPRDGQPMIAVRVDKTKPPEFFYVYNTESGEPDPQKEDEYADDDESLLPLGGLKADAQTTP